MELTVKCKEDFKKWMRPDIYSEHRYSELITNTFDNLPQSMKYGVYVDFFESVGIYISIDPLYDMQGTNRLCIYSLLLDYNYYVQCRNRQESRIKAIEKANEIYNEKYK